MRPRVANISARTVRARDRRETPAELAQSLDYLVRPLQERRLDRQAERLRRLEVDGQLEFRRLLDGQHRWLGAFQDLVHLPRGTAE